MGHRPLRDDENHPIFISLFLPLPVTMMARTLSNWLEPLRGWVFASIAAMSLVPVFLLAFSNFSVSFLCVAVGIIPHPTQALTRGLLCLVWVGSPSQCDHLDMSGSSKAEFASLRFNLYCLPIRVTRIDRYLSRVSISPSCALLWALPRKSFQIIYG